MVDLSTEIAAARPEDTREVKPFACPDCNRKFKKDFALDEHRAKMHGTERTIFAPKPEEVTTSPFYCRKCNKRLRNQVSFDMHNRAIHAPPVGRRPSATEIDARCLECGKDGELVTGEVIYPHRPDLYSKHFYLCECGAYCGCHPNSIVPLGHPCGPETRKARSAAHAAFDPIWKRKEMSRASAYKWLAAQIDIDPAYCHIGMMTASQAWRVVAACNERAAIAKSLEGREDR